MEPHEVTAPSDALAAQFGWVRELARALVGNSPDADDIAQEVWLRTSSHPAARDRAWLSVVTRHVVVGLRRSEDRRRRRETVSARPEAQHPDDVLSRAETCQRVLAAVMALSEPYRSTVLHRYVDGLSVSEIAAREQVREAAVRKRLSRAMGQLRTQLDEEFEGGRSAWMAALIDVAGRDRSAALPLLGAAGVGFVLMKKALLVAAVLVVVCLSIFTAAGRTWLGLDGAGGPAVALETASGATPMDPALGQPESAGETRASVVPPATATAKTIVVEGVVANIPYPETSGEAVPAAGVVVTARIPSFGSDPLPEVETTTDAAGTFRLAIQDPGTRPLHLSVHAAGDERYRPKSATIPLDEQTRTFERRLERAAHGDLSGIVVDEADRPVADTVVQVGQASGFLGGGSEQGKSTAPGHTTTTDESGRFTFHNLHGSTSFHPGTPSLVVEKAGFRTMPSRPPSSRPRGGWDEAQIRLLSSGGRITLRVLDSQGAPRTDVSVAARISNAEPGASWEPWDHLPDKTEGTDADGRVTLEDLWVGRRLALTIQSKLGSWLCERAISGRIDLGQPARGGGIVIPDSKTLALEVLLPATTRITGRVVDPAGTRVPGANVILVLRGGDSRPSNRVTLQCDSEGRIETVIARPTRPLVIDVAAYTGKVSIFGSIAHLPADPERMIGRTAVEFDPSSGNDSFFEIVVHPALSIAGTVRNTDGTPCKGKIAAIPVGAPKGEFIHGGAPIDEDGRFEIGALLRGEYVLDVRPSKNFVFTDCLLSHRFDGVTAGRSDVELVLGEDRGVEVEIEASATDGKPAEMTLVIGMFHPYESRDPSGHVPDAKQKYAGLSGWPSGATLNFGGQTGHVGPDGVTAFLHVYGKLPLHRLAPMNEGWYTLGVDARDARGARYHASGTGLVYLKPGAYRFHFDLVRQSAIEGLITNVDPEVDLGLMLVTPDGKPVSVQRTDRTLDEVVSIGAAGRFRIDGAPVGEFRLRVGTERELRSGTFVSEIGVNIAAKDNPPLRLMLP